MFGKRRAKPVTSGQFSFSLDSSSITYVLRHSSRSIYLRLEIKPEIGLVVIAPQHCSPAIIENFIQKKQRWILKNIDKYQNTIQRIGAEIINGSEVYYLGRKLSIEIHNNADKPDMVRLENGRLLINLNGSHKKAETALQAWYHFNAESMIREKLIYWSSQTGINYINYKLRGQRTRWGSCSRQGNLSFNWKLVMAPESVIDYVIIHELAHLKEMNHSGRFWTLVSRYCPEYKVKRKWLRDQDHLLAY